MQISILDGNPDESRFSAQNWLRQLNEEVQSRGHSCTIFDLKRMDIKYCTGCWGCWVKTPGECVVRDDTGAIRKAAVSSDLVIFASPLIMGFPSALLKKTMDKFIPLLHPYIELVAGECHHRKRYPVYPKLALIRCGECNPRQDEISLVDTIFKRFALNFRSELSFTASTAWSPEEVSDEIDRL